jgi:hypothetical protein
MHFPLNSRIKGKGLFLFLVNKNKINFFTPSLLNQISKISSGVVVFQSRISSPTYDYASRDDLLLIETGCRASHYKRGASPPPLYNTPDPPVNKKPVVPSDNYQGLLIFITGNNKIIPRP